MSGSAFGLPKLMEDIRLLALELSGQEVENELVGARLMDGLRDASVAPMAAPAFADATKGFDAAAWLRLDLLTRVFRETAADQSVYDELLVVHPPKRIVGGLTLKF